MNKLPYMTVKITIPTYMSRIYHGLFDTGANICLCKKDALPPECWKISETKVLSGFNDEKNITNLKAENIKIMICKGTIYNTIYLCN